MVLKDEMRTFAGMRWERPLPGIGVLRAAACYLLVLLWLMHGGAWAQPVRRLTTTSRHAAQCYQDALQAYRLGQYSAAIGSLAAAQKADARFIELYLLRGQIYEEMGQWEEAMQADLQAVAIDSLFYTKAILDASRMAFCAERYAECTQLAHRYLACEPRPGHRARIAQLMIASGEYAQYAMAHPVPIAPEPVLGGVNTSADEYFPSITADGKTLSFTRKVPGDPPSNLNVMQEDMYLARWDETAQAWGAARTLGAPVDSPQNEGAQSISALAQRMYFTRCNGPCNIYYTDRQRDGRWGPPRALPPPVNVRGYSDKQPSVSSDGRTLYFASNRPGGHGGYDVWCSTQDSAGHWGPAINLGPAVNTFADEQSPFMHFDNSTLFFASNGHPGLGDLDLFRTTRQGTDTTWSEPQNLGYPINTAHADMGLIVAPSGSTAYYASGRRGEQSGLDIYSFTLPDSMRPTPVSYLKGIVEDGTNGKPLSGRCQLVDLATGDTVMQSQADEMGQFIVCLPVGRSYGLFASCGGYIDQSLHFDFTGQYLPGAPYEQRVRLMPLRVGASTTLRNVFFATDSDSLSAESHVELNRWVELLKRHTTVRIRIAGHTDNQGTAKHNMSLSRRRAESVSRYLQSQGIAAKRIESVGHGASKPVKGNDTAEGRAENRRTECHIISL